MLADLRHRVAAELEADETQEPCLRRFGIAGLVASLAVVAGAVAGGSSFISRLPGAWFFGTPGGPLGFVSASSARAPAISILAVYGGMAALCVIWWRLLRALHRHPGMSVRGVVRTICAWAVPFVLAPPLFSRDVYSYAGQGEMVTFHIDPYHYGPGVLGATRFNLLAGPLWANTPSPYGPTFLSLDGLVTRLSDHQVLVTLFLLRGLALLGVALVAVGLPTLARGAGRDPAAVLVLGVGSPLVLATLIGGAHNDALMVGLLVAGLAAWQRFGPVPGIVLCALAAGVKVPAALGIIVIGWNWAPQGARLVQRVGRTLGALGIGAATLALVSAVTGIGWGWVVTVTAPDKVSTGVTPVDAVAHVITAVLHLAGSSVPLAPVRTAVSITGVVTAVVVGTVLLWRSPQLGPIRALGMALLVLALLSPVLWAWYLTWGLILLAPVAQGVLRRVLIWLSVAESLIGVSAVLGLWRAAGHDGALPIAMVVVGVGAAILTAARAPYAHVPPRPRSAPSGRDVGVSPVVSRAPVER